MAMTGEIRATVPDLAAMTDAVQKAVTAAIRRCGLHCQREAIANAPRSPTKKQRSATLTRKRRTATPSTAGQLEKSIALECRGALASIYVAANGYCRSPSGYNYAKRIHDEKGSKWWKRGAGTIAKGARADEKFIERAVKDNADKYQGLIEKAVTKALQTG